jgi:hypothetical protein
MGASGHSRICRLVISSTTVQLLRSQDTCVIIPVVWGGVRSKSLRCCRRILVSFPLLNQQRQVF